MNLFLDTSAVIKLYHKEVGSDGRFAFLNAHAQDLILTISDITRAEFHSAFLRRVRMQEVRTILPCSIPKTLPQCHNTHCVKPNSDRLGTSGYGAYSAFNVMTCSRKINTF